MPLHHRFTTLAAIVALCGYCALALTPLQSQAATSGSGHSSSESRQTPPFQAVAVEGSIDLELRQGAATSVQVQADDNLLPLLQTTVEGSGSSATLQVRWQRGAAVYSRSKVVVTVVTPTLSAVSMSGAGDAHLGTLRTPVLKLSLAGSGDARLDDLQTADLSIRMSGSGDVTASGRATVLAVSLAGSGDVDLSALNADDVSLRMAGSGDAAVHAEKTLDVRIAGSGDVVYSGAAAIKSRVAGSGSVTRR
ncbi:MAG: DUF2807 domain-containing protein [Pseudomonadota bacterium]|nr:DUF2807 domain-containing protein [Pseudomonadota bacterium]